jgi:hypothetical protein
LLLRRRFAIALIFRRHVETPIFIFAILRLIFLSLFISPPPPCSDAASLSAFQPLKYFSRRSFRQPPPRHAASAHVAADSAMPASRRTHYRRQRRSRFSRF